MSSDKDSVYHQFDPFSFYNHHELNNQPSFQFFRTDDDNPSSVYTHRSTTPQQEQNQFDPSSHTSFAEYLHGSMDYNTLSRAFDLSCSSNSEVISSSVDDHNSKKRSGLGDGARVSGSNQSTVNSSVSSSSNEAEAVGNVEEEDSAQCKKDKKPMGCEDQGEDGKSNKKENKPKKEKKPRAPRFAFLTKSDVDHLEDGYRWRKYGQKAVKNSPYPRSYYRCTTQKCMVKKRVERSFQDPSVVITTYEGQHNHHAPATLRSNAAAMLSSSSFFPSSASTGPSNLPHELLVQLLPVNNQGDYSSSIHQNHLTPTQQQQQFQFHEYGLLQDLLPSFSRKDQ